MPLLDDHQIVSVDDHLVEHPRVWQDRLPAALRERGPRIVDLDGKHVWTYDGDIFPTIGLNAVAGKPPEEWGMDPVRYEDMIPGCYDPTARIAVFTTGRARRSPLTWRPPEITYRLATSTMNGTKSRKRA